MENWVLLRKGADFAHISEKFHISPRIASLIRNRDVIGDEAIAKYLNGTIADLYDGINGIRGADPSRIAASIVSGVGFLGAGAIFVRKQIIQGLTTAAGIWATAGVGLAIGAGMYFIGIASAVIILLVQIFLHKTTWFTKKIPVSENISVVAENSGEIFDSILKTLKDNSLEVLSITSEISENEKLMTLNMSLKVPYSFDVPHVVSLFAGHPGVRSVDI